MTLQEYRMMVEKTKSKSGTPARQLQGGQARRTGAVFEEMVSASCDCYRQQGVADIEKTPEPVRQCGPMDERGVFPAHYEKKAQPDYKGTLLGGRSVIFEAKHTDEPIIRQSRLTPEQADRLESHHRLGAVAFVLVSHQLRRFYRVPWEHWRDMRDREGALYLRMEEMDRYMVPVKGGHILFLQGIFADSGGVMII